jgi:diacylglycerol kinase family enzyme
LIPARTANTIANSTRPTAASAAANTATSIATRFEEKADAVGVNGRLFLNNLSLGIYARRFASRRIAARRREPC